MKISNIKKIIVGWASLLIVIISILPTAASATETIPAAERLPFDPQTANTTNSLIPALSSITGIDLGKNNPLAVTVIIVNTLLTLLGIGFLLLLLYAGVVWVWARGNDEEIKKAKQIMRRAVFGLIIILGAFGISELVFYAIYGSTVYATLQDIY